MKRLLDIVASAVGVVMVSPLFIFIAIVNKLTGNDVFFCQTRTGKDLKDIRVIKFATMVKDAHLIGSTVTCKDDPRITPIGRYLRKSKLNELPQLLNVLKGDMSLVGPRPLAPNEVALYRPEEAQSIYSVRPGLTGWATLHFHHEEEILPADPELAKKVYKERVIPKKAELEQWYVEHRGFWLDISILLKTLWGVAGGSTKYEAFSRQEPSVQIGSTD